MQVGDLRLEVDEEVEIAALRVEMVGDRRPEDTQPCDPEPLAGPSDRIPIEKSDSVHGLSVTDPRSARHPLGLPRSCGHRCWCEGAPGGCPSIPGRRSSGAGGGIGRSKPVFAPPQRLDSEAQALVCAPFPSFGASKFSVDRHGTHDR